MKKKLGDWMMLTVLCDLLGLCGTHTLTRMHTHAYTHCRDTHKSIEYNPKYLLLGNAFFVQKNQKCVCLHVCVCLQYESQAH